MLMPTPFFWRYALLLAGLLLSLPSLAKPPQLLLDVARFRNPDQVQKGAVVELYLTVPTQPLTYRQRAPRAFQSAATVTLEILKADGKAAYQETITLKPPVLNDTSLSLKNPQSFLRRLTLPDGRYTLRGTVRDLYNSANGSTTVEKPLELGAPAQGAFLSDVVLLARPAAKASGDDNFIRGGYRLTRAPAGVFARGADNLYFYAELLGAPSGPGLRLRYFLSTASGRAAEAEATLTPLAGQPTPVLGQLAFGNLPEGEFTLTVELRNAAKQVLASQTVRGQRFTQEYAPAGAPAPR